MIGFVISIMVVMVCLPQGEMAALFLRHEGFLGAMGAFLKVHPMTPSSFHTSSTKEPRKVHTDSPWCNLHAATSCLGFHKLLWGSLWMHHCSSPSCVMHAGALQGAL